MSGGPDEDSILGDNGQIVRQLLSSTSEFPWMNGMVWLQYTEPFDTEVVRDIRRYDDVDEIGVRKSLWFVVVGVTPLRSLLVCRELTVLISFFNQGNDNIEGGDGNDILHGQRGDDGKLIAGTTVKPHLYHRSLNGHTFYLCFSLRFSYRWWKWTRR